jgi:hypothetical protein
MPSALAKSNETEILLREVVLGGESSGVCTAPTVGGCIRQEVHSCGSPECSAEPPAFGCGSLLSTGASLEHGPFCALVCDGSPYQGDLVADILEYRELRRRLLGGGSLGALEQVRFDRLQLKLRPTWDPARSVRSYTRAYERFDCDFLTEIQVDSAGPQRFAVRLENLSAGGAKLASAETLEPGQVVSLLMPNREGRAIALPARVAWSRGTQLGLMFAGAPTLFD